MNCESCGKAPATVRYAEVVDGALYTWHICEDCARERGVTGSLTSLAGPLVNILMGLLEGGGGNVGTSCPKCGLSYAEFRTTGRLGCAVCYEAFGSELKPLLRRIHGGTEHSGGVPKTLEDTHAVRKELSKLKAQLKRAVSSEKYERAAELRDLINAREAELGSSEKADVDA